jgi:hypothetical protein
MKNLLLSSLVVALIVVSVSSCSKGDRGPAGPAGASGSDSVIHSAWITLSMTQNTDGAGDTSYSQSINAASITESVISNAVIVSYIGLPDSGPNGTTGTDTLIINASDVYTYTGGGYLTQDILPGLIELYSNFDLSGILYRYVIVPSAVLASSEFKQYTPAQIKAMDYATVTKLLNAANAEKSSN